jgi:hypothetical protein
MLRQQHDGDVQEILGRPQLVDGCVAWCWPKCDKFAIRRFDEVVDRLLSIEPCFTLGYRLETISSWDIQSFWNLSSCVCALTGATFECFFGLPPYS